jgi:hypothetical protein
MGKTNIQKAHLKHSRLKRLTHLKVKYHGSISQRVSIKNNPVTFEFIENEEEYNLDDLSEFHLEIITNALRERNWGAKVERLFGLTIFIALSLAKIQRKAIINILLKLGTISYRTAQKHCFNLISGQEDTILEDNRGHYHRYSIFEDKPDLKQHLYEFTIEKVSKKNSEFSIDILQEEAEQFLENKKDKEETTIKIEPEEGKKSKYSISYQSMQNLLFNWGFYWSNNKARPFVNGHERDDVVSYRKIFIDYFANNLNCYWMYIKSATGEYKWSIPDKDKARIVISHDESTVRSGDTRSFKWLHAFFSPMFNKGRGISRMVSDFIVCHPSMTTFFLTEKEWKRATEEHPELLEKGDLNFTPKTATSIITPGKDSYFDNEAVLTQFTRLLTLLRFSEIMKSVKYRIDILVDNATTHTKALSDVSMFGKSPGTACSVNKLKWIENGIEKTIDCFNSEGQSKGLFLLCKEIGIIDNNMKTSEILLADLRIKASSHPAFIKRSRLEELINEHNKQFNMNVKIVHTPKFHCELNPIEMYWAQIKNYFRKINDQSNNGELMEQRIIESKSKYEDSDVNDKLWGRFFRIVMDYKDGLNYGEIMKKYFKAGDEIKSHRKTTFNVKLI